MKRLLTLMLCLCLALTGCAAGGKPSRAEEGGTPPETSGDSAAEAETFERLALALAEMPALPEEPDESALWERMDSLSADEQDKLWDEFSAQQSAYYEAVQALRGEGVDPAMTPAFARYTLRTVRQLLENAGETNVVYSPANLYLALCMLCETADGESRAQLLDLLGLEDAEQAGVAAASLWRTLYNDSAAGKTLLANSLWLNGKYDYHEDVVNSLARDFFASTFRAPMGDKETDAAIARWINANTNGLLADAASQLETTPDMLLMLISTLYFKGAWADQFEANSTYEDVFTDVTGAEQKMDFMHTVKNGTYYRGENYTVASLPFRDGTSMWFLLPDEGTSVQSLLPSVENLTTAICGEAGAVQDTSYGPFVAKQGYGEIHWSVPKFDLSSDLDLIPQLEALGVTDIFTDSADFSPLTDLDAAVSAVKHAARVKVDEEGCEAAAFTAVMMEATSALVEPLPVVEMDLERPFGFLITGVDGMPLFTGVMNTAA